jgi:hypothetical protein
LTVTAAAKTTIRDINITNPSIPNIRRAVNMNYEYGSGVQIITDPDLDPNPCWTFLWPVEKHVIKGTKSLMYQNIELFLKFCESLIRLTRSGSDPIKYEADRIQIPIKNTDEGI